MRVKCASAMVREDKRSVIHYIIKLADNRSAAELPYAFITAI